MLLQQIAMSVAAAGESGHEAPAPLWAEPWVFGVSMFSILVVLMFIAWSYNNLGNRHAPTDEHADPHRQHPNKHDRGQGH
ncbi:hypothetical protein [Pseudarthrobacter phenanthrenivorans]|uniref:hypothetical protein n=1 Tax=Pseudarthrobacter phenanthrenivorans TaxID=361575 RepID=UPI002F360B36